MFTLDQVVPWGRSFDEYRRMFALAEADLRVRIIGCGDGPAGFNAEATRRGVQVISCDPIYRWETAALRSRIAATYDPMSTRPLRRFARANIRSSSNLSRTNSSAAGIT
jgi:hypothetical protein